MRAVVVTAFGGPEVLELREAPIPEPAAGQVRVRVAATTVNFADIQGRRASYVVARTPPFVPGLEAAGTIDAIGPGVTGLEIGQRVSAHTEGGSYAEYALARAIETFPIPDSIDLESASTFPSVGTTALNLLTLAGRLQPGETVLVQAAAGGVGSTAVQLARTLGAGLVIGTAGGPDKVKTVLSLGADAAIDYRLENVAERVREITAGACADVVLDGVGASSFEGSLASLAPFGRLVAFGQASGPPPAVAFGPLYGENKTVIGYSTGGFRRARPHALRPVGLAALRLMAQGRWKPLIGARFPLAQAAMAHRMIEDRESIGKVLLIP
ncbi:MAG TPA: quinone oxidoreductase [Chloroflexota bacterium]|nr:quinone oxidoreductase [Chloroflexota bacterium]